MPPIPAMEFDIHSTYFSLKISKFIFLLFDDDPEVKNFLLDLFDFFGIPAFLFLEFLDKHLGGTLQISDHDIFLFLNVNNVIVGFFAGQILFDK